MWIRVAAVAGLIIVVAAGCSSSGRGGGGGAGGQGGAGGGGTGGGGGAGGSNDTVTWNDAGTAVIATQVMTGFYLLNGRDTLDITASTAALSLRLIVSDTPPLTAKAFMCTQLTGGPTATAAYTDVNTNATFASTGCTVTLTQVGSPGGPPAVGTFDVLFSVLGAQRELTNGAFSVRY